MFIAHLPAGYLLTRCLARGPRSRTVLVAGLLGSVVADLDMFYFYLVDGRSHLHHTYWTHIPFFWLLLWAVALGAYLISRRPCLLGVMVGVFFPNVLGHLVLDSVAADILWLYPFSAKAFGLIEVPARFSYWVLNYIFHWTFLLEVLIVLIAVLVYLGGIRAEIPTKPEQRSSGRLAGGRRVHEHGQDVIRPRGT